MGGTLKFATALFAALLLTACATTPPAPPAARTDLAPSSTLRAGINLGNGVVATRDPATGQVRGIAVNVARELGRRLGVPVETVVFDQARMAADAMQAGTVDVVFIAIEPARAAVMDFTAPYAEIAGVYAVPPDSNIRSNDEVDRAGVRITVVARSNYDLFLTRTLKNAQLIRSETTKGSEDEFAARKVDVYAGVKQRAEDAIARLPGAQLLPGQFMAIRQAIGMSKGRPAGLADLKVFVEDIKASGLVAREIEAEGLKDASVAPSAP
jgi:polar amino acid transport system substrate-binding protein